MADTEKMMSTFEALLDIKFKSDADHDGMLSLVAECDGVTNAWLITGEVNCIAQIHAANSERLSRIANEIRETKGVSCVEVNIVTQNLMERS